MSIFSHTRVFNAAPEAVFGAFRDPALLARWWGPEGFRNTFQTFDFREGGDWVFIMHGPDGTDYPNQARFLEIRPPNRIRIQHVNLPHFLLTVDLEPAPGGTDLTWVGDFEDSAFAEKARGFLERANEQNLDRLEGLLASASSRG